MSSLPELVGELRRLQIRVWVEGESLRVSAPQGALTPALRAELVALKAELISFVQQNGPLSPLADDAIPTFPRTGEIPLSFAQQRLVFLDQLDGPSPTYNIPFAYRLRGPLDIPILKTSFQEIAGRHAVLHARFSLIDGAPVQVMDADQPLPIEMIDLSTLPFAEKEPAVQRMLAGEARRPFDLSLGPLARATLIRLDASEHVFLWVMHHIIGDGWSLGVLLAELSALYHAFLKGDPSPLPPLPIQYADFARWQREWLKGEVLARQLSYWQAQLAGAPALELPTDHPRPAVRRPNGRTEYFAFSSLLRDRLNTFGQQSNVTLFMTLLGAVAIWLARHSGQPDIVIGTTVANRNRRELEPLIGFFANTLALRVDLSGNPTFQELVAGIREIVLGALDHQDIPFEKLVEVLHPERSLSETPIFQVMFSLQNTPGAGLELDGIRATPLPIDTGTAKFDQSLSLEEDQAGIAGTLTYSTDLFEAATINQMIGRLRNLLEEIARDPSQRIDDLSLLSAEEDRRLLLDWNDTAAPYRQDECIHQLFEAQVARTPHAVALSYQGDTLTFDALNRRANLLAHFLIEQQVGPEVCVGLCVERSLDMLVGVLGILKAGGAFVPIDPDYPPERLAMMLQDSGAPVLVTQQHLTSRLPVMAAQVVCLDTGGNRVVREREENPIGRALPENTAYLIYTSGSTGIPKGVVIQHRSVLNLWAALDHAVYAPSSPVPLNVSVNGPLSFDTSVKQWIQLLNGHTLHIIPGDIRFDGPALLDYIERYRLDVLDCTPSQLRLLLAAGLLARTGLALCKVLVAGEAIDLTLWLTLASASPLTFYDLYGPTECTVDSTIGPVLPTALAPNIGRPVRNAQVYLLDVHLRLVPLGVPGELYIGGAGLARGYLHRPDQTAARFVPNPFASTPGERLYRTGDRARYLPDGTIEFLGRVDRQVKIRGYRIELGEIETVLEQHPRVLEALLVAREVDQGTGHKQLIAYIRPQGESALPIDELRGFIKTQLPDYMIPAAFVLMEAFPLTSNGKIDHRRLPDPDSARPELAQSFVAPRTPAEQILADIWQKVLGVDRVGIHDNFFDLGGDSILSLQIVARATQAGYRLAPRHLFQYQTIAGLATVVAHVPAPVVEQGPATGPVLLTPIQRRFFEQDHAEPNHWNQSMLLMLRRPLVPAFLKTALAAILKHHDALRLRYERAAGEWRQWIALPDDQVSFDVIDLSTVAALEQAQQMEDRAAEMQRGLNLANGPLIRVAWFKRGAVAADQLFIVIHHLVVDGVSWRILLEDLQTVYGQVERGEQIRLPDKTSSYKRWAKAQSEYARTPQPEEVEYWLSRSEPAPLLPVDDPAGVANNFEAFADTVSVALTEDETRALLQDVPPVYHTQMNDVLLTALAQTWTAWTGQRHVRIDLEGHGRQELSGNLDLSRTVGWFTSVYPVWLDLPAAAAPGEALVHIKEQLERIPNKGVAYGVLYYLSPDPLLVAKLRAQPPAGLCFNYLGQFDQTLTTDLWSASAEMLGPEHSPHAPRRYLLDVTAQIIGRRLIVSWTFGTRVHRRETVARLAEAFLQALRSLITYCLSRSGSLLPTGDLALVQLDRSRLELLVQAYPDWEAIYPLAPGQAEMLAEAWDARPPIYVIQQEYKLRGVLDVDAFKQAWQQVIAHHAPLRTAFMRHALANGDSLQIVLRQTLPLWREQDWSGLSASEQRDRLAALIREDQALGFDLAHPPLMRWTLVRLDPTTHYLIWTHHHLTLDGWSIGPLWQEIISLYRAFHSGTTIDLPLYPFRDYIAWLLDRWQDVADRDRAQAFWQKALASCDPAPLFAANGSPGEVALPMAAHALVSAATTAQWYAFAQQHRLTPNTLLQGAFALLLSRYSGRKDVTFGVTVSGRPTGLAGVEQMIGPFVRTLPMPVQVLPDVPLVSWLGQLQTLQIEMREHDYWALPQIKEWGNITIQTPFFDSFLRFQNYPRMFAPAPAILDRAGEDVLETQTVDGVDWWHYPLGLMAVPGKELALYLTWDARRLDSDTARQLLNRLESLLASMVDSPTQCLVDLMR
ncbi:MAG: amino acid adenylation domain-containing protein [Anaerolineae bacterium]